MNIPPFVEFLITNAVVIIGATIGSVKAQLSGKKTNIITQIINIILGIFAGTSLAFHYIDNISVWGASILALVTSSMSVAVVDTLFKLAPDLTSSLAHKWTGIDINKEKKNDKISK